MPDAVLLGTILSWTLNLRQLRLSDLACTWDGLIPEILDVGGGALTKLASFTISSREDFVLSPKPAKSLARALKKWHSLEYLHIAIDLEGNHAVRERFFDTMADVLPRGLRALCLDPGAMPSIRFLQKLAATNLEWLSVIIWDMSLLENIGKAGLPPTIRRIEILHWDEPKTFSIGGLSGVVSLTSLSISTCDDPHNDETAVDFPALGRFVRANPNLEKLELDFPKS
jgi:hypothetical protein